MKKGILALIAGLLLIGSLAGAMAYPTGWYINYWEPNDYYYDCDGGSHLTYCDTPRNSYLRVSFFGEADDCFDCYPNVRNRYHYENRRYGYGQDYRYGRYDSWSPSERAQLDMGIRYTFRKYDRWQWESIGETSGESYYKGYEKEVKPSTNFRYDENYNTWKFGRWNKNDNYYKPRYDSNLGVWNWRY